MKLIVLLSTYNGEAYLREQLDSLLAQTLNSVGIFVRDDGSTDSTRAILTEYAQRGALCWYTGMNLGAALSFWQLLQNADDADYYAFCDQDDVWDPDKLEIAFMALEHLNPAQPALYCGDVRITDEKLHILSKHMVRPAPTEYPYALLRNLAPGCTYIFNRPACKLLRRFDAKQLGIELHDWTTYQLVSCFGNVIYDSTPHMSYRQHGDNAIGTQRTSARMWLKKASIFWSGPMKNSRSRQALRLEQSFGKEMCAEYRELTALLAHYREDQKAKRKLLHILRENMIDMDSLFAYLLGWSNKL